MWLFSDTQKLKEFITSVPTVQKKLKEILQAKGKLYQTET